MEPMSEDGGLALPRRLRLPLGIAAGIGVLVVLLLGFLHTGESTANGVDAWVESLVGEPVGPRREVALMVDFGGEPVGAAILVAVLAGMCLALRRFRLAILTVACLVPAFATTPLKDVFDRTINDGHLAYPSGHTAFATAIGIVFGLLVVDVFRVGGRAALAVVAGTALLGGAEMAWAQTSLDAHYATDTLGGFATAFVFVPVLAVAIDAVAERAALVRPGGGTPA
ncbi:phosphatase PAP2 family protein [Prauserella sp. PE36]|uniref:phosphatase PAP2 family protein n=1 Tax=Prauserella sp. PE36 TaxID=1504709 RepID=UPI001313DF7E|nr:phosphatase PAP2 family protein [Prauserella sp. PE36]